MPTHKNIERSICLCNTHATWGGGEKWHLNTAKALVARGWHVTLLANQTCRLYDEARDFAATLKHDNLGSLRVIPLTIKSLSFLNPCVMARLVRFFRQEKVQTLVMGLPAELKSVGLAAKMAGVPRIIYRRGSALPVRNSSSNRYLYGSVLTGLIVNSQQTRDLVLADNAQLIDHERIHLLPNGLDVAVFDAALQEDVGAQQEQSSPTQENAPIIIGNAGRLDKQKAQHYLIRMMPHLVEAGLNVRLRIAGHGALHSELEALAHELGVSDRVELLGFMSNLGPFWHELDIFVLSSLWEGFGYVLVEAMAAKVPVVAFGISNIPEIVEHGVTGLLVQGPQEAIACKADSTKQTAECPELLLAQAVMRLAKDASVRHKMGDAGRAHVLKTYTQERCMDSLEAILLR